MRSHFTPTRMAAMGTNTTGKSQALGKMWRMVNFVRWWWEHKNGMAAMESTVGLHDDAEVTVAKHV